MSCRSIRSRPATFSKSCSHYGKQSPKPLHGCAGASKLCSAHMRLLVNVPEPERIVREMVSLVRPGGWVASLEADVLSLVCDPPNREWTCLLDAYKAYAPQTRRAAAPCRMHRPRGSRLAIRHARRRSGAPGWQNVRLARFPRTEPIWPTRLASKFKTPPGPQPMSTTRSPGLIPILSSCASESRARLALWRSSRASSASLRPGR